jgi:acyl-CoA synthetase (AMP-forming)/AMP-acid ligase II
MPAPPAVNTLLELLELRARDNPHRPAFTFLGQPTAFEALWQQVNALAGQLLELGLAPGERVVLAVPNSAAFFAAFFGAQRAGGIAVPAFPGSGPERLLRLAALCGARLMMVPDATPPESLARLRELAAAQGCSVLTTGAAQAAAPGAAFPPVRPDDIAYLQYTSGSTGDPKGVQLTHANLLTNLRQMIAGMEITARDVFASWLPVFHDMGLVLMTMVPFYLAADLSLLPANLKDIRPWLAAISQQRATFTAAPDFAYRLCVRQVPDPRAYDLTSLRVALNAAEPVRAQTIAAFEHAFGLKPVMVAGYGLAEATVGVAMWPPGTPPLVDERGLVSVGRPFPGIDVQIVEGDTPLPAGVVGEVVVRSPANTAGYFQNAEATARLAWRAGYLRTGDLGYLDSDGCLFIAGRLKNIIKRAGQTIYPQEVEEVVDGVPGLRYSAAVGIDRGRAEGEQVYVFAEVRAGDDLSRDALHALAVAIVDHAHAQLGFRPGRVYLLRPHSLPLTHNGKLQHAQLRADYLSGELARKLAILYPEF